VFDLHLVTGLNAQLLRDLLPERHGQGPVILPYPDATQRCHGSVVVTHRLRGPTGRLGATHTPASMS